MSAESVADTGGSANPIDVTRASQPLDWDAETYHRTADDQEAWGREVLDRLALEGDETVLDAGCGSGRVTRALLDRLPRGRVIAVDASPSMVAKARESLGDRAEVLLCDLRDLELAEPVDAIVSTATLHWIPELDRVLERFSACLRPSGRLVVQCGGEGNIAEVCAVLEEVCSREPFAAHFAGWPGPWTFRSPTETVAALNQAGFAEAKAWLQPKPVDPTSSREFLVTSILGAHLDRLPNELRDPFIDAVATELSRPDHFDYIRLNFTAVRP